MKRFSLFTLLLLFVAPIQAEEFVLNEQVIYDFVKSGEPPSLKEIESSLLSNQNQLAQFQDQFKFQAFSQGSYAKTKEEALISFQPIFSPTSDFALGAKRSLKNGIQLQTSVGASKRDFSYLGTPTTGTISKVSVSATIDLWKNLLGRVTKAQSETLELSLQSAKLQKNVQTQVFLNNVRMLYWQLVANDEALKISEKLLASSIKQEREAVRRLKNSIADQGEVARYRAQVATRQSQITSQKFQRQQILQALRQLLPELQGKEISLGKLTLDNTVDSVLQCVGMLKSKVETPLQYSLYDDLNQVLSSIQKQQVKIAESYSKPDLVLTTGIQTSAVDEATMDSFDEAFTEEREGYQVGLQLNIPLGLNDTKKQLVKAEKLKADYQIKKQNAILESQHQFINQSISYLLAAIQSQGVSKKNLEIRVADVQKKYRQGRISVTEYIVDQDNLLQTELQIIETKYLVVKTLLDYLSIFTHTPCAFNRIVI